MSQNHKLNSFSDVLRRNADKYPETTALVTGDSRLNYKEFNEKVNRLANSLKNGGAGAGTNIAGIVRNRNELMITLIAVNRIGAVYVPLNYRLAPAEIKFIVEDSEAELLIFDPAFIGLIKPVLEQTGGIKRVICLAGGPAEFENFDDLISKGSPAEPEHISSRDDLLWIAYTSGTTGFPKGVMSTNGQLLDICQDHPFEFAVAYEASAAIVPPAYGAGTLGFALQVLFCHGSITLLDFDPVNLLKTIEKEKIEIFAAVPIMLKALMAVPNFKDYDLSSIKYILFGAAPMTIPVIKELKQSFPCHFQANYAMTETGGGKGGILTTFDIDVNASPEKLNRITSAGRAQKDVQIRVVREDGTDVEPGGEVGEILINCRGNMKGYWKNPEATSKTLVNGFVHTGDMAWIDEDHYIFIVDRKNDMIKSGSANVYPAEVEIVLGQHPAVAELAVFGIPDEEWGELVCTVIVTKPGMTVTAEELLAFCQDKIAGYKKPKKFIITADPLPRNGLGKVLRKELKHSHK